MKVAAASTVPLRMTSTTSASADVVVVSMTSKRHRFLTKTIADGVPPVKWLKKKAKKEEREIFVISSQETGTPTTSDY